MNRKNLRSEHITRGELPRRMAARGRGLIPVHLIGVASDHGERAFAFRVAALHLASHRWHVRDPAGVRWPAVSGTRAHAAFVWHGAGMYFAATRIFLVVISVLSAGHFAACDDPLECRTDPDCDTGELCASNGSCVDCITSDDCSDGGVCCRGGCTVGEVEAVCGCDPAPDGELGVACTDQLCLVSANRATANNVADGVCECPCDPGNGGTQCNVDLDAESGFSCGCDRQDPVGTCEAASIDAAGIAHRLADTCSPQNTCVCFNEGGACGASEDCTDGGCVDLVNSDSDCGVEGRVCGDAATGTLLGQCQSGGCECDVPSDCSGVGLNVDDCGFAGGDQLRCLCDGYVADGQKAPCPMALECVIGGCQFDAAAYATFETLVQAVSGR